MAYICEKSFSAVSLIKTKERNRVNIQAVLRPEDSNDYAMIGKGAKSRKRGTHLVDKVLTIKVRKSFCLYTRKLKVDKVNELP